jgi:hypothetical protein
MFSTMGKKYNEESISKAPLKTPWLQTMGRMREMNIPPFRNTI